jgi:hypothetical protein
MAYDFPNSPTVGQAYNGWVWDGQKWQVQGASAAGAVRYDIAQGLTANQMAQGRANIGALKKNYIINGAMMISQENGATAATFSAYYPVDQFSVGFLNTGTQTSQQIASATPGGSPNRLRVTATVADASVDAGDACTIEHRIEGYRVSDLRAGSASAKTITIQFGVKAPAGTYCVAIRNGALNRAYVAEYVISSGEANTNVVKSVTIALDQTGTWAADNTLGLDIVWTLMVGSTYQTTANAWQAGNFVGTSNQFNFMGTVNNVFELFDVGLYEGNVAPPFMVPDYASELAACQRYWRKTFHAIGIAYNTNQCRFDISHNGMRGNPTLGQTALSVATDVFNAVVTQQTPGSLSISSQTPDKGQYDLGSFLPALTVGRTYFLLSGAFGMVTLSARL